MCFPGATGDDLEEQNEAPQSSNPTQDPTPRFQWTEALQQNFREELEKLVILDYMMRNTGMPPAWTILLIPDRGLDNWMIKICWDNHSDPEDENPHPHTNGVAERETTSGNGRNGNASPAMKPVTGQPLPSPTLADIRASETLNSQTGIPQPGTPPNNSPHIHIGAIDNSLAFPWKHPDEWRSFPLYSPLALISN